MNSQLMASDMSNAGSICLSGVTFREGSCKIFSTLREPALELKKGVECVN